MPTPATSARSSPSIPSLPAATQSSPRPDSRTGSASPWPDSAPRHERSSHEPDDRYRAQRLSSGDKRAPHGDNFRAREQRDRGGQRLWQHPGGLHPRPLAAAEQLGQLGGLFQQAGYAPLTPDWPDDPQTIEGAR